MISVITPSMNSAAHIKRAISTVLLQGKGDIEHIVVDGGSSDETVRILQEYPHLIWISEPDAGQSDAMNKGLAMSKGDLIVYLNVDDEFCAGWLKHAKTILENDQSIDVLVGNLIINKDSTQEIYRPSVKLKDIIEFGKLKFPLNPVSYVYRKSVHNRIGQFPIRNHHSMDYWFLLRLYLFCKVEYTDFTTGVFHLNANSKTANYERAMRSLNQDCEEFLEEFRFHPTIMKSIFMKKLNSVYCRLKNGL